VTISTNKINIGIDKTWHTIEFSNNRRTRFQRPNKQPFRSGATFQTYPIRTPEANRLAPIRCPFPTSPPTLTLKQTTQSHRFSSVICGGLLPLVGGNSDYITHLHRTWQIQPPRTPPGPPPRTPHHHQPRKTTQPATTSTPTSGHNNGRYPHRHHSGNGPATFVPAIAGESDSAYSVAPALNLTVFPLQRLAEEACRRSGRTSVWRERASQVS